MGMDRGAFGPAATNQAEASASFEELLRDLAAVHASQGDAVRRLAAENGALRDRLQELTGPGPPLEVGVESWPKQEKPRRLWAAEGDAGADSEEASVQDSMDAGSRNPSKRSLAGAVEPHPSASRRCSTSSSQIWQLPEPWPEWVRGPGEHLHHVVSKASSRGKMCSVDGGTGQAMFMVNKFHQKLVMKPNSPFRLAWDFLSSFMVIYDVINIPLMAITLEKDNVLGGGTGPFVGTMDYIVTGFWIVDIPCSFLTGFFVDGGLEMRVWEIAKHYAKSWFPLDALVVTIDCTLIYMLTSGNGRGWKVFGLFRVGKTARMARILRALRLLRFIRLQRVVNGFLELINSETMRASFNVMMAVLFILVINHYLACGWFLVGHMSWSTDLENWIESNRVEDRSEHYAYFTSLHWALTQFTPASMEIRPYNVFERIYSISVLIFALVMFSSFLGSISSSVAQLRKHSSELGRQQYLLRAYFHRNKVSSDLSRRIWHFLKNNHLKHHTRSHKTELEILTLLPEHLQGLLHQELYGPYITRVPFFYQYTSVCSEATVDLCCKGITEKRLTCGDSLFFEGKVAKKMYFTISGYLRYNHCLQNLATLISAGAWVSEPALWVKWVHVAPLIAETSAEILELDSEQFRAVAGVFKHSLPFAQAYAEVFFRHLSLLGPGFLTDVMTDVPALAALTREAWQEAAAHNDTVGYQEMPSMEFPRGGRTKRVRTVLAENDISLSTRVSHWFSRKRSSSLSAGRRLQ